MGNKIVELVKPNSIVISTSYKNLLEEIKQKLQSAQFRASISVNHELMKFYWDIGKLIVERQESSTWGDKLFETLAHDLSLIFPQTQGFSKTNLKNMRTFYLHYPHGEFSQALPDQLTWTHHTVLNQLIALEDIAQKQWYAQKTIDNGWAYRQLQEQIKSDLYVRQADKSIKTTNFQTKLPSLSSDLAHEMVKDPYKFHFLTVGDEALPILCNWFLKPLEPQWFFKK